MYIYINVYHAGCGTPWPPPPKTHDPYVTGSGQSHNINVARAACAKLRLADARVMSPASFSHRYERSRAPSYVPAEPLTGHDDCG